MAISERPLGEGGGEGHEKRPRQICHSASAPTSPHDGLFVRSLTLARVRVLQSAGHLQRAQRYWRPRDSHWPRESGRSRGFARLGGGVKMPGA